MNRSLPNMPLAVDPASKDQPNINRQLTEAIRQLWLRFTAVEKIIPENSAAISELQIIVNTIYAQLNGTRRITVADSPYSVQLLDTNIFADTDGGEITVLLRPGTNGAGLTVRNCGGSGNDVVLTPDGTDLLFGLNLEELLIDGEVLDLKYETTEGWF